MNEQDAMTRLAAANPVPGAAVRDAATSARAEFLIRTVVARPGRRPARRTALIACGVATAAAAATVVAVTVPAPDPVPRPAAPAVAAPKAILSEAAGQAGQEPERGRFLHATGNVARVVHVPSAGGYHVMLVDSVRSMRPADGLPGEGWLEFGQDGSSVRPVTAADAAAYRRDGSPGRSRLAPSDPVLFPDLAEDRGYDGDVTELPGDPARTGTAMVDWVAGRDGFEVNGAPSPQPADVQGWLFREGVKLLDTFTSAVAGADRAKIYRMLAGLTGVRTLPVTADPLGRPALGLAYTGWTARYGALDWQIFLGAGTDRIISTQAVVVRPGTANASLRPGAVQYSTTVTSVTWSDRP